MQPADCQTDLGKWLGTLCLTKLCVCGADFQQLTGFIIAPASVFTPELGRRILSFFCCSVYQSLYQQHRQTLE